MFYSKKLGIQKGHLANMLFCSYLTEYIKDLKEKYTLGVLSNLWYSWSLSCIKQVKLYRIFTFSSLLSTKKSNILKQTCSFTLLYLAVL